MAFVGLLFVGVVLIVNGLMLLGVVDARSAAPLNIFVGALQVLTPTYLIFRANLGDTDAILAVSGIYLFGFTYLYVGINLLANLDGTGLGWYSIFVTACACVFAALNFGRYHTIASFDPGFGVIWLYWAFLWAMFWVVLGLKREQWTRYTGGVAVVAGVVTTAAPAFLLLTGQWATYLNVWVPALAVILGLSVVALLPLRRRYQPAVPPAAPVPSGAPEAPEGVPVARGPVTEESRRRTPTS
jgi:putative amide transporter protein